MRRLLVGSLAGTVALASSVGAGAFRADFLGTRLHMAPGDALARRLRPPGLEPASLAEIRIPEIPRTRGTARLPVNREPGASDLSRPEPAELRAGAESPGEAREPDEVQTGEPDPERVTAASSGGRPVPAGPPDPTAASASPDPPGDVLELLRAGYGVHSTGDARGIWRLLRDSPDPDTLDGAARLGNAVVRYVVRERREVGAARPDAAGESATRATVRGVRRLPVRREPWGPSLGGLGDGDRVRLEPPQDDSVWYRIRGPDGTPGYLPRFYLEFEATR